MIIRKGKHRAWPWRIGLWFNKTVLRRKVVFDFSCAYKIEGEDQYDTNKLFGIGYFPSHHKESARFGWYYDPDKKRIIISAYCYVNKERVINQVAEVFINRAYEFHLFVQPHAYDFYVFDSESHRLIGTSQVLKKHSKKIGYPLGLFFGGSSPAPQDITVKIQKL